MAQQMVSRVDPDTLAYLTEVSSRYAELDDEEERRLLLGAALEEIQGNELRIATDAATSRMLEVLLAGAGVTELLQFMKAFSAEDALYSLAGGAFGSHVAEKVLMALDRHADSLEEEATQQLQELLGLLVGAIGDQLYEYIMDKHATHVARRLLCVIVGRDVLPPEKKRKQQQQYTGEGDAEEQQQQQQQKPKQAGRPTKSALAEKLEGNSGAAVRQQQKPARYPEILRRYARMLPIYEPTGMSQLAKNQYSSPFLQAMLRAAASDRDLLLQLLLPVLGAQPAAAAAAAEGSKLATISDSHVGKLMRDECYSHVLEVVMAVAPHDIFEEIYSRFLKGRLLPLTSHHSANFVVQSMFAACTTEQQFQQLFNEISSYLGDLLQRRRSGVMAAAAAAAGRLGCCQTEVAAAIAAALGRQPKWEGRTGSEHLAPALLTLDTSTVLNTSSSRHKGRSADRLSTAGCVVLATLLKYPPSTVQDYLSSMTSLAPAALSQVAADPSGSRVVEALLLGPAPLETKRQLLQQLQGQWADVAMSAPGSFVVEKAFDWTDMDGKEAIARDITARLQALTQHCYWGPKLSSRLGLEAYQRNPQEWRKRTESAATTKAAFSQLFDKGTAAAAGQHSKRELRRQQKARKLQRLQEQQQQQQGGGQQQDDVPSEDGADAEEMDTGAGAEQQQQVSHKKRKHADADAAAAGGEAGANGDLAEPSDHKKSKRKQKHKGDHAAAAAAAAGGGGVDIEAEVPESQQHFLELLGFGAAAAPSKLGASKDQKKQKTKQQEPVQVPDREAAQAALAADGEQARLVEKKERKKQKAAKRKGASDLKSTH